MTELDLRLLRMLVAVADEGVMGRAADRLHLTQPALSKQLATAERVTGLTLFDRHARGMTPTVAGRRLVDRARAVLAQVDGLAADVQRLRRETAGVLRLGYLAQTLNEHTRRLVAAFENDHAGVAIEKRQFDLRDMTAGLAAGTTDVALLRAPVGAGGLVHEPVFVEQRVAALWDGHPATSGSTTELAALFDTPWVVNATEDATFRAFQLALAHRDGRPPLLGPTVHTVDEILDAVSSRRAIALGPASAARYYPRPGVVYVPVVDAEPSVCTLSWRANRPLSPAAAAFVAAVRASIDADRA